MTFRDTSLRSRIEISEVYQPRIPSQLKRLYQTPAFFKGTTCVLSFEDSLLHQNAEKLLAVAAAVCSQVVVMVAYGISTACLVSALYLQAITWILGAGLELSRKRKRKMMFEKINYHI